jgi:hypothetical protein
MIYHHINQGLQLCFAIPSNEEQHDDGPIIKQPKHPTKGEYKEQNGRNLSKKTNETARREPPRRADQKGNIKFFNPLRP